MRASLPTGSLRAALRRGSPALLLLVLLMQLLAACGSPGVSGTVLPEPAEQAGLPWHDVEVRLLRGDLAEQLKSIAAKHRNELLVEARQQVLASAKAEHTADADALQPARAGGNPDDRAPEGSPVRACLPTAEANLTAAKHRYVNLVTEIAPRIASVGITGDSPSVVLEQLHARVHAKVDGRLRELRDEYLRTQLDQQSAVVLASGMAMDRLCWNVQNKRDLAVQFRGPVVEYNAHPLPSAVANSIWALPLDDKPLRIPNPNSLDNDVLLPGASFETCFYARGTVLPQDLVKAYGLAIENPTRSGEWHLQWQDIQFVSSSNGSDASPKERQAAKPVALEKLFADRIEKFQSDLEETRLIEQLSNSDGARALSQAEKALVACHRAIEREKNYQESERVIQAIEGKQNAEFAVDVRVRPVLEQLVRDHLARWVDEAAALVEGLTVGRQQCTFGKGFQFADVKPGRYTLLAKATNEKLKPKVWVIPVEVEGKVATQDLVAATWRDKTMRATLEDILRTNVAAGGAAKAASAG